MPLQDQADQFVRIQSREGSLDWADRIPVALLAARGTNRLRSEMLSLLQRYRDKNQLGRFRTGVILAVYLEGRSLIEELEKRGFFLCEGMPRRRFPKLLSQLVSELAGTKDERLAYLRQRLTTYLVLWQLMEATRDSMRMLDTSLQNRSPLLLKSLVALTELSFLSTYLDFDPPKRIEALFELAGSPEQLAAAVSLITARANELSTITGLDFGGPVDEAIGSKKVKETLQSGLVALNLHEIISLVTCFGYSVTVVYEGRHSTFRLDPPSLDFELYLRLGYIRKQLLGTKVPLLLDKDSNQPKLSMRKTAESLVASFPQKLCKLREKPYRRIIFEVPLFPSFWELLAEMGPFVEDFAHQDKLFTEFLLTAKPDAQSAFVSEHMNVETYVKLSRVLRFLSLINVEAMRGFQKDTTALCNSLVKVITEDSFVEMLRNCGVNEEEVKGFLQLTSWDVRTKGFYDIQYQPFIKIEQEYIYLPGVFALSNDPSHVQRSKKFRLRRTPEMFVDMCESLFKAHFSRVTKNRSVKKGARATDVDIVVFEQGVLYLFECKHSLPPFSPHEMRDVWQDIRKGVRQLKVAQDILQDEDSRQSYLAGWFPGTRTKETRSVEIRTSIICSQLVFGGMMIEDVPVRDFSSLSTVLTDHSISMGVVDEEEKKIKLKRYSIVGKSGFSQEDLNDYLGDNSKYFEMFRAHMDPFTKLEQLIQDRIVLAKTTFIYNFSDEFDLKNWTTLMDSLGFRRLTDEEVVASDLLSPEDLSAIGEPLES